VTGSPGQVGYGGALWRVGTGRESSFYLGDPANDPTIQVGHMVWGMQIKATIKGHSDSARGFAVSILDTKDTAIRRVGRGTRLRSRAPF